MIVTQSMTVATTADPYPAMAHQRADQSAVMGHQWADQSAVMRADQQAVMRDQSALMKDQSAVMRDQSTVMRADQAQLLIVTLNTKWKHIRIVVLSSRKSVTRRETVAVDWWSTGTVSLSCDLVLSNWAQSWFRTKIFCLRTQRQGSKEKRIKFSLCS